MGKKARSFFLQNWVAMVPYIMLILIIVIMGCLNPNTLSLNYIANKIDSSFTLVLVAIGQTFVLLTGGFDLSVGGVICITNCLTAAYMKDSPGSMAMWVVICCLLYTSIGSRMSCFQFEPTIKRMENGEFNTKGIATKFIKFSEIEKVFELMEHPTPESKKMVILFE